MKRSKPLARTAPLEARTSVPLLKMKKCSARRGGCGEWYRPFRPMQKACGPQCASSMVEHRKEFERQKAAADDKRKTRAQLEALKTIPQLKKEAQHAVNRYVRLRDAGKGCFVCGVPLVLGGVGGGFDAGHIRSRSNADNLRFDERNIHGQCKPCNRPGATKDWQMREAADRLLGAEVAAQLHADNKVIKWQRDQLRAIRDEARRKARALEKQHA